MIINYIKIYNSSQKDSENEICDAEGQSERC